MHFILLDEINTRFCIIEKNSTSPLKTANLRNCRQHKQAGDRGARYLNKFKKEKYEFEEINIKGN